ncbi:MAG: ABC transporter ATP-binding protein, partial [Candidatus Hermodarchaeota archaeon]
RMLYLKAIEEGNVDRLLSKVYILGFLTTFLWSFLFVLVPFYSGTVIDVVFNNLAVDITNTGEILTSIAIFGIIIFLNYGLYVSWLYLSGLFSTIATQKMRLDIFEALQYQSQKFYVDQSTGDLVAKSTADLQAMVRFFIGIIVHIPMLSGQLLFIMIFLFLISPSIGMIGLFSIIPILFFIKSFEKRYSPLILESRNEFGQMSRVLQENIDGILVSKIFNANKRNNERFDKKNSNYRNVKKKSILLQTIISGENTLITGIMTSIVLLIAGLQVIRGALTLGALISALMVIAYLINPLREMIDFSTRIGDYKAVRDRINDILSSRPSIVEAKDAITLQDPVGKIQFRNVSFSFGKEPVLTSINLKIPENSSTALLGASGSGKSSLINLIIRFYDVNTGSVTIDGRDIRDLTLNSLRKMIGFVDQETFLFSKSIKDNICFGAPSSSDEDVRRVARIAQIDDFIMSLPDGYDTIVGERGVTLSGGQRQRLSIARALLTNPKIIVFDDSLSAVDLKTEREIQQALSQIFRDKTVIFVTQRLSIISAVDNIVILDKGHIVEQGTHNELINEEGVYNKLFQTRVDDILDLSIIQETME